MVIKLGRVEGLCTKKDLLRYIAATVTHKRRSAFIN